MTFRTNEAFPSPRKNFYKVYVLTCTFNQSLFIEDCLNGVAKQKTNFPFVHHVVDDASTDGEQNVIKAWMEKECDLETKECFDNEICSVVITKLKNNTNCTVVFYFLKKNMYGNPKKQDLYLLWREVCPYEALCEGDDYWIDENKLQRQYDWLEEHPEYSMCWHDAYVDENGEKNPYERYKTDCDVPFVDLVMKGGAFCPSASLFFRHSCFFNYVNKVKENDLSFYVGDYPLQMYMGHVGKVRYMKDPMCVYRVFSNGSWTQKVKSLSKEEKVKFWDKEHQLLMNMNVLTDYKYEHLFEQRWYLYAFRVNCMEKFYDEAKRFYGLLDEKLKRDNLLVFRMIGMGYPKLGWVTNKLITLKKLVFRK